MSPPNQTPNVVSCRITAWNNSPLMCTPHVGWKRPQHLILSTVTVEMGYVGLNWFSAWNSFSLISSWQMGIRCALEEEWLIERGFLSPLAVTNYFGLLPVLIMPTVITFMNEPQFCGFCWYEYWPIDGSDALWWSQLGYIPFAATITHTN